MERKRGTVLVLAIALVISVIGLGVAFAAFSTTLNINGNATVNASSWDIHFSTNGTTGTAPGSSGTSVSPTASNTQSGIASTATGTGNLKAGSFTWEGTFKTPGDKLTYTFYVCNKGTFDAKVTNVNAPALSCKQNSQTETTICNKITYGVYKSSTQSASNKVATGDTLNANTCTQLWVIATLGDNITAAQLPTSNVTVEANQITVTYGQK